MLTCMLATNAMPAQNNVEMDRTDICKENYRTLFGREALTGEGTDPEMMAILQKFIFGEVFTTGDLTLKQREMITCITLATMQTLPQLKAHAAAAHLTSRPGNCWDIAYLPRSEPTASSGHTTTATSTQGTPRRPSPRPLYNVFRT